jgi:hypothetical protein
MTDEFTGDPTPLRLADYENAALTLGCTMAAIRAVAVVESAGRGFLSDRRPKILFERHVFHKLTVGRFAAASPELSSRSRGGYLGGAREYDRLRAAMTLDRSAALQAASWGKFQVMGFNHGACGHDSIESLVRAMVSGETAQLAACVAFIKANKLDDDLRREDWSGFARGYNGPDFARNAYDRKLARAHARFTNGPLPGPAPLLKRGDTGAQVRRLQTLLRMVAPDAVFGAATQAALMAFQRRNGLTVDGIAGPGTWRVLLA